MDTKLIDELTREVDERILIQHLAEMVAIKSENPFDEEPREGFREKEMADYFMEQMHRLGLEVSSRDVRPHRPNVFGLRKGTGKAISIMLAGHMDTARTDGYPDAYDIREVDGKIYGRGACDMKAALAANLEVVRILNKAGVNLKGDLYLAGIVDEEYGLLGSLDIGQNGPWADQGIIGEPTDLLVCPANKGRVSTFIRTFGKATHSSVPEKGENAIVRMADVIDAFSGYNDDLQRAEPHELCGHGRFTPGVIRGGVQVNMVPDLCELEVDRRTLPGETKSSVYAEFAKILDPLVERDPGFKYEITEPTWFVAPNDVSVKEPAVLSLLSAYETILGHKTQVTAFPGGSDAPNMGFPNVVCGPGSIGQAHSTNEYVEIKQLIDAAKIYLNVVLSILG
jgi:acetylornithine deacetylase/succinyl-diaminopimelate desuccinylase family protein